MRILLVLDTFLPAVSGGSEMYARSLALGLQAAGHDVVLFHTDRGDTPAVVRRTIDGIPCVVMHRSRNYRGHGNFFGGAIDEVNVEFSRLLSEFEPDIVHINHLKRLSPDIPRLSAERGVPVFFTLHDYWLVCDRSDLLRGGELCTGPEAAKCAACNRSRYAKWAKWEGNRRGPIERAKGAIKDVLYQITERESANEAFAERSHWVDDVIESTTAFIAPSRFLQTVMTRNGVPAEKIRFLDYGMDEAGWQSVTTRRSGGRLRFGFFGSMSRLKGIHILMDAFDSFYDAELRLYGRNYYSGELPFAKVLNQENVTYHGVVSGQAKIDAYANVDVVIAPSMWYENSPLVIHEAFMAGKPVITSNIGGMADLVPHEKAGLQFEMGSARELRRAIERFCREPELLPRLCQGLPGVTPMAEHIDDLLDIYAESDIPNWGRSRDSEPMASESSIEAD